MCKYGNSCTFAHGETDLRTKMDNSLNQGGENLGMGFGNFNYMDPNLMMMMSQNPQMYQDMNMGMPMMFPPGIFYFFYLRL